MGTIKMTVGVHTLLFITNVFVYRLIRHTEKLLEEKEEKLCVKVLRTLREMMAVDPEYGDKVGGSTGYDTLSGVQRGWAAPVCRRTIVLPWG